MYLVVTPYYHSFVPTKVDKELDVIVVPEHSRHVFYCTDISEYACMARPAKHCNEEGFLTADCVQQHPHPQIQGSI
jgi:hypothetical protein